jgi:hypothetical protein
VNTITLQELRRRMGRWQGESLQHLLAWEQETGRITIEGDRVTITPAGHDTYRHVRELELAPR